MRTGRKRLWAGGVSGASRSSLSVCVCVNPPLPICASGPVLLILLILLFLQRKYSGQPRAPAPSPANTRELQAGLAAGQRFVFLTANSRRTLQEGAPFNQFLKKKSGVLSHHQHISNGLPITPECGHFKNGPRNQSPKPGERASSLLIRSERRMVKSPTQTPLRSSDAQQAR